MRADPPRGLSTITLCTVIVLATFGLSNVVDNLVTMRLALLPSWIVVGVVFFLPLSLILAEFASDTTVATGGIYSYLERGLGSFWAFVGIWSYGVANLFYLQSRFSRLPIYISMVVAGRDVFEGHTVWLPVLGVAITLLLTFVATRGVRLFARIADVASRAGLLLYALLIVVPLAALALGMIHSATVIDPKAMWPQFDLGYLSTFSWLLFAVAGVEVAGPYVRQMRNPRRDLPRAVLIATALIAALYILTTLSLLLVYPLDRLNLAAGLYDVWGGAATALGLAARPVAAIAIAIVVCGFVAAYVVWMESTMRVMFAEAPAGTFPRILTRRDAEGTHHAALWWQAVLVIVLTLLPLLSILTGHGGSESFIGLLNDLSSLSLIVPYLFLTLSYVIARHRGMDAPYKMLRSTPWAMAIGIGVFVVCALAYLGAGLSALNAAPIDWIYVATVYGGPLLMIAVGLALRAVSLRLHRGSAEASLAPAI